jgi:hypothetical protein
MSAKTALFLKNAWYRAGWPDELGEALLRRQLISESVLLFRKQDGLAAPLIDRDCVLAGHRDLERCKDHQGSRSSDRSKGPIFGRSSLIPLAA